ncbi:hypothetical protein BDZ85DRAFT_297164 [Elsinoe ampelina]|uniref:Uncharacterized protein n=1 Tax=Elsinoe ampelina TaxID=302913 RepID=A0A6A6G8W7_9PEZI|nr:hypothetical protein BDZ85DRAFT_297164 [Elsinoe ampelina]
MTSLLPSHPPVHTHRTLPIAPSLALSRLESYLSSLRTTPHHHPDALLTPAGVNFHPSSGPNGNLQITNLRRVLAGLKGENLSLSPDDLLTLELLARKDGSNAHEDQGYGQQEDSFVFDGDVLRRRLREGVGLSGIGPSASRGLARSDGTPVRGVLKKRKLDDGDAGDVGAGGSQESVSQHALKRRDERRGSSVKLERDGHDEDEEDEKPDKSWMDLEAWQGEQEVVEGEVGERSMPVVKEGGVEPVVRETEEGRGGQVRVKREEGDEEEGGERKPLTKEQRERRKAEKKRRVKDAQRANHGMKRVKREEMDLDSE